jgi:hypothetical protein
MVVSPLSGVERGERRGINPTFNGTGRIYPHPSCETEVETA